MACTGSRPGPRDPAYGRGRSFQSGEWQKHPAPPLADTWVSLKDAEQDLYLSPDAWRHQVKEVPPPHTFPSKAHLQPPGEAAAPVPLRERGRGAMGISGPYRPGMQDEGGGEITSWSPVPNTHTYTLALVPRESLGDFAAMALET